MKLPKELFEHTIPFYNNKTPSAVVMRSFMQDMRNIDTQVVTSLHQLNITDTCRQLEFLEHFKREQLQKVYHTKKESIVDWLICGYHYAFENKDVLDATRCHFSRLEEIWDSVF